MAENKVVFEVQVTAKGLKQLQKSLNQTNKETKKQSKNQKEATQSGDKYHTQQKAIHQTNLSSAKGFSKMNQTIGEGGSSGLVGAYATLAANVFAATAAFNALKRAAQIDVLVESLSILGAQSGQNLGLLATGLRDAAGGAIDLAQAMQTASVGASAGFDSTQIEGLAKVAKMAALALGRDVGDAVDRLTRGAAKLEPEILDELGIFVRLDDAAANYATSIGKTANELTRFEKRQAFANEILEQGQQKFGALEDLDASAFDRLGATLGDLAKDVTTFFNAILGPIAGFFAENKVALLGFFMAITKGIMNQALPMLNQFAATARKAAQEEVLRGEAAARRIEKEITAQRKLLKPIKNSELAYNKLFGKIKQGTATTAEMRQAELSLAKSIQQRQNMLLKGSPTTLAARQKELNAVKKQQIELKRLMKLEEQRRGKAGDVQILTAGAKSKRSEQAVFRELDKDQSFKGYMRAFGLSNLAQKKYKKNLGDSINSGRLFGLNLGFIGKAANRARPAIFGFGLTAKIAIKGIFTAIPVIGQLLFVLDLLIIGIKKVIGFIGGLIPEASELSKANKALASSIAFVEKNQRASVTAFQTASEEMKVSGTAIAGLIDSLDKQAAAEEKAEKKANIFGKSLMALRNQLSFLGAKMRAVFDGIPQLLGIAFKKAEIKILEFNQTISKNLTEMPFLIRLLELSGIEPPTFVAEDEAAKLQKVKDELAQLQRLREISMSLQTTNFFGAGAIEEAQVLESVLKGTGPAAQELARFLGTDDINKFAETLAAADNKISGLPQNIQDLSEAFNENGDEILQYSELNQLLVSVLKAGTRETTEMSTATTELQGAIKEGNTKLSEYLNTFTKKGAINAFAGTVKGISEQVEILAGKGQAGGTNFAGIAIDMQAADEAMRNGIFSMLQATPKMQEEYNEALKQHIDDKEKGVKSDQKTVDLMEAYGKDIAQATAAYTKLVNEIERAQLFSAATIANLQQEANALGKFTKMNTAALDARIQRENDAQQIKIDDLEREQKLRKAGNQVLLDRFKDEEERAKMTSEELGKVAQIKDVDEQISKEKEKLIGTTERQALLDQEILAVDVKKLQAAKQLAAEKAKELSATNKLASAQSGGGVRETPAQILAAQIKAKKEAIKQAKEEARINAKRLEIELLITKARLLAAGITDMSLITEIQKQMEELSAIQQKVLDQKVATLEAEEKLLGLSEKGVLNMELQSVKQLEAIDKLKTAMTEGALKDAKPFSPEMFAGMNEALEPMRAALKELGPEGELIAMAQEGILSLGVSFMQIADSFEKGGKEGFVAGAQAAAQAINVVSNLIQANTKAQVHAIDQQIEAEKKRDGKSIESVNKIKAMEAKKEAIQRKAFEQKKKMDIASAIISTALGITRSLELGGIIGPILAAMTAAMGMAQIALIKKQTFQGGAGNAEKPQAQRLEIGKRDNRVDVSRGASSGELAFLRGQRGFGSNANNFTPGGAAGMKRSYAAGGEILVGERGPEIIQPTNSGFNVIPNDQIGGGQNINFNISTVDATGVQELLVSQRGNIIEMIREAANDTGEFFLEDVDTQSMGGSGGGYG